MLTKGNVGLSLEPFPGPVATCVDEIASEAAVGGAHDATAFRASCRS